MITSKHLLNSAAAVLMAGGIGLAAPASKAQVFTSDVIIQGSDLPQLIGPV